MIFLKRKSSIFSSTHNIDLPNVDVNTTPSLISDVNTISRKNTVRLTTYWTVTKIPYDHQINVAFKNEESLLINVIFLNLIPAKAFVRDSFDPSIVWAPFWSKLKLRISPLVCTSKVALKFREKNWNVCGLENEWINETVNRIFLNFLLNNPPPSDLSAQPGGEGAGTP